MWVSTLINFSSLSLFVSCRPCLNHFFFNMGCSYHLTFNISDLNSMQRNRLLMRMTHWIGLKVEKTLVNSLTDFSLVGRSYFLFYSIWCSYNVWEFLIVSWKWHLHDSMFLSYSIHLPHCCFFIWFSECLVFLLPLFQSE